MSAVPQDVAYQAFLDAVLADAEGRRDNSAQLANDPEAWRVALIDLLDELRVDIAAVNAELKGDMPIRRERFRAKAELSEERAVLVERQQRLDSKLRHVKLLCGPPTARPLHDHGTPLEQAQAHLRAALSLLSQLADSEKS
jgi:hypothetical protein